MADALRQPRRPRNGERPLTSAAKARQLRVFLSYQMEDAARRDDFVRDVVCRAPMVRFLDYPVTGAFDGNWKEQCTELIRSCAGTIVLIGYTTFQSKPVAWEIAETSRRALPLIGVRLFTADKTETPVGLEAAGLMPRSDLNSIVHRLQTWDPGRRT
jgi:MTH538 TIR-like domain (DUF1863)